jgi:hypothetical protein
MFQERRVAAILGEALNEIDRWSSIDRSIEESINKRH